ncbi:hypothetical protein PAE9249_01179 [Paenibacillus sp. CECT 9249]|uniref:NAD-dependent epimerase/dehydratase family protein n=1 Tax=Paenibacillus sp. CECT 9249 TaxID=2845385 RepID=UPI001E5AEDDD|nr:NAD-dependent epimerase/dehydratase family protein [Paenibacillus sp. CECT 9249]CAH0118687.1 hypothetical protein PAE9249_01179 [Paenibacillus sp. CECT 9249]
MQDKELHVVFGAGALGQAVISELLAQGKQVRAVNRSGNFRDIPHGAERRQCDAREESEVREVCKDATVIYHCMGLPYSEWQDAMPAMMRGMIEGAASANAKLIYADNLYAYGPVQGEIHEGLPHRAVGRKTKVRGEAADMLMEAHRNGAVRAAIGRGSDFYGPGVLTAALGAQVFGNALAGRKADLLGNPKLPHTHLYIRDFARGLAVLGRHDKALGQIWHIPAAETVSTHELAERIFKQLGIASQYRIAGKGLVSCLGLFHPMMREMKEMMYQFSEPFTVDHSKYVREFGLDVTPHDEAIAETIRWYRNRT